MTHYYFCFRRSSDAAILLLFIVSCVWALPSYSLSAPFPASALFHVVFLVGVEVEEVLPSCSHLPFSPARVRWHTGDVSSLLVIQTLQRTLRL